MQNMPWTIGRDRATRNRAVGWMSFFGAWRIGTSSATLTQSLHQLLNNEGFGGTFTGTRFKSSTTRRFFASAEPVDRNDTAGSAARVSTQGIPSVNRPLHYAKAITRRDPGATANRTAQGACCLQTFTIGIPMFT